MSLSHPPSHKGVIVIQSALKVETLSLSLSPPLSTLPSLLCGTLSFLCTRLLQSVHLKLFLLHLFHPSVHLDHSQQHIKKVGAQDKQQPCLRCNGYSSSGIKGRISSGGTNRLQTRFLSLSLSLFLSLLAKLLKVSLCFNN